VTVSGQGTPLLLLHGFTGSGDSWTDVISRLSDQFQCVAVDIVGHGGSACPDSVDAYRMEAVSPALVEIMDQLGHERFGLLGYSMGGRLALHTAWMFPDRVTRLALESATPGIQDDGERAARRMSDERLADDIERFGVPWFVDKWEKLPLFATHRRANPAALERQRRIRVAQNPRGLANSLRGMGTGAQPSLWNRLPEVRMPVLVITGDEDHKFCDIAERMAQHLPLAVHRVVSGAGHTVHLEQTEVYVDLVRRFFREE
jgi:2-succinyl-6-hydroxy-2,4-cyclohexadiene-1-carboxylate synthase